ncbi:zinc finger protein 771-like isoform X1 [Bombyx mandarina]|uniref:Zinc finger protein 771-like isoform X1 n=1 Tax=Bombyx mandarina TaxID=7092 RepID=A0A6J2JCV4_BOMMA|nr:zinc finger protein 771-like isoform X1 [Bombyx mandarina]
MMQCVTAKMATGVVVNQPANSKPASPLNRDLKQFDNICRTCAQPADYLIPIFEGEGLKKNLPELINKHLPIMVSPDDGMPHVLCYHCATTVLAWHELKHICVHADEALRQRFQVLQAPIADEFEKQQQFIQQISAEQEKSAEAPDFAQPMDLPEASASLERIICCVYCGEHCPQTQYRRHVVSEHAERIFHCEDCDSYVDREIFIPHMSSHAMLYARQAQEERARREAARQEAVRREAALLARIKRDVSEEPEPRPPSAADDGLVEEPEPELLQAESAADPGGFSEHSDDDRSEPLPDEAPRALEDEREAPAKPQTVPPERPARACPVCGKTYRAASSYFYHVKHAHGAERAHACPHCDKKFTTRAALREHGAVHSGERRHACQLCGKRFGSRAGLYIHAQTHGSARQHRCATCGAAFRWRTQLQRHQRRHAPARPHACELCARTFRARADLQRHRHTHAARRLRCPRCDATFAQPRYLRVHLRNKHAAA